MPLKTVLITFYACGCEFVQHIEVLLWILHLPHQNAEPKIRTSFYRPLRSDNAVRRCTKLFILSILFSGIHEFFPIALVVQQVISFCFKIRHGCLYLQFNASVSTIQLGNRKLFTNFCIVGISLLLIRVEALTHGIRFRDKRGLKSTAATL